MIFRHLLNMRSHPTWVRGLKHVLVLAAQRCGDVAPYVGAWIETILLLLLFVLLLSHPTWVRGLKLLHCSRQHKRTGSHPTWVRGLKLWLVYITKNTSGRTLRGCVD